MTIRSIRKASATVLLLQLSSLPLLLAEPWWSDPSIANSVNEVFGPGG
jgi:hypothetical protein